MAMWQFEPEIVAALLIAAAIYLAGVRSGSAGKWWRHALFFGGLFALALALLSPIEPLADHVFAIHQIEHMLLRSVGPMLLLLSQPQAILMRGIPEWFGAKRSRRSFAAPASGRRSASFRSRSSQRSCSSE